MAKLKKQPPLSSKQNKFLKGLGHHLNVKAMLGKEGLTEKVVDSILAVLKADELIKVKLQENFPYERKEGGVMIAEKTGAALVQVIGRTVILYKANIDLAKDKQISLP